VNILSGWEQTEVDFGPLYDFLIFEVVEDRASGKDHHT
jgi:hypothetical protein